MSLLTVAYVQQYFPLWEKYFLDDEGNADENVLQDEIDLSEAELAEYLLVDEDTITDSIKRHVLNIIKYRGFNRLHGDIEFENKPQIVRDYEATIMKLTAFKNISESPAGTSVDGGNIVSITSKARRFGEWFNEIEGEQ